MAAQHIEFEIEPNPAPRLDKALGRDVPAEASLSRSRLAKLIVDGAVQVNGTTITDPRFRVEEGAQITVTVDVAEESHIEGEDIPLDVVYEDDDLIVINKPSGMVVHPAPGTPNGTLVNALIHHCGDTLSGVGGMKRPGIVHRIDKETTGLLVAAKTDRAHHSLSKQFADHTVERRYIAMTYGVPEANDPRLRGIKGTSFEPGNILKVQTMLGRHRTDRQRQAVSFTAGRHAVTRCRILEPLGTPPVACLVECWLETGRTHQIRVHMAHCGHALIGDPTYGGKRKMSPKAIGETGVAAISAFARQALHAATLGFIHPATEEFMEFEADLPDDMLDLLRALGSDV